MEREQTGRKNNRTDNVAFGDPVALPSARSTQDKIAGATKQTPLYELYFQLAQNVDFASKNREVRNIGGQWLDTPPNSVNIWSFKEEEPCCKGEQEGRY